MGLVWCWCFVGWCILCCFCGLHGASRKAWFKAGVRKSDRRAGTEETGPQAVNLLPGSERSGLAIRKWAWDGL